MADPKGFLKHTRELPQKRDEKERVEDYKELYEDFKEEKTLDESLADRKVVSFSK